MCHCASGCTPPGVGVTIGVGVGFVVVFAAPATRGIRARAVSTSSIIKVGRSQRIESLRMINSPFLFFSVFSELRACCGVWCRAGGVHSTLGTGARREGRRPRMLSHNHTADERVYARSGQTLRPTSTQSQSLKIWPAGFAIAIPILSAVYSSSISGRSRFVQQ